MTRRFLYANKGGVIKVPVPAVEGSQYTKVTPGSFSYPSSSKFIKFHPGEIDRRSFSTIDIFSVEFGTTYATNSIYMLYANNNIVDYVFNFDLRGYYIYANKLGLYDFYIKEGYISWYMDGIKKGYYTKGSLNYIDSGTFLLNMRLRFNRDWNIIPDFTMSFVDNEGD